MCEMTEMTCCVCHIKHSIPVTLFNSNQGWTCPNGHALVKRSIASDKDKLRTEVVEWKAAADKWMKMYHLAISETNQLRNKIAEKIAKNKEVKRLTLMVNRYKSIVKKLKDE